ncbi:hypothetical protein BGW80DRAFT_1466923 [Lactifluus volemus]|nr:hypothetical protein BGW80DRAFT_1466923 [Lactifluus volemus]
MKSEFHKMMATAVFSVDNDANICMDFHFNPVNYTKSVDNYITRLWKEYRSFNKKLGQTGAGLQYKDLEEGSNLQNLVEQLEQDFPYWKHLHGFWCTLPNFNPYTASSEPGQDLAAEALALVQNRGVANDDADDLYNSNDDMSPSPADDIGDHTNGDNPDTKELAVNDDEPGSLSSHEQSPTPAQPFECHSTLQTINSGISMSTQSTPLSKSSSVSIPQSKLSTSHSTTLQKTKGKRTHQWQDAFMDENKAEAAVLASITVDKHAQANGKRLEAKDCRLATQYQHEREKEQHDMQMLHLCLQYQGGSGITGCAAPAAQFVPSMEGLASPSTFEDMGMGMGGNYLM